MVRSNEKKRIERNPRYHIRLPIITGPDHQKLMTNYSVNLTTGGVYIETNSIQPVNTRLIVEFMLPNGSDRISCKARVAWVNISGHIKKYSLPPGMGLQFLDLSWEHIHSIRDFLNNDDLAPVR